jgi:adenosylcobinamide-GDP ribazoletransferase
MEGQQGEALQEAGSAVLTPFAAAIQFLLISPAFVRRAFTPAEMGRSTAFYPAVGAMLGGILIGVDALLKGIFPVEVRSVVLMALWIILTGALHFDGLLDSVDGLFGGHTPERRLQIMRDERTGAYGVAAAGLILLTMFSALNALPTDGWPALLAAPILGRCGISLCIAALPYARKEGLGRDIKDNAGLVQAAAAVATTVTAIGLIVWGTHRLTAATACVVAILIGAAVSRFVMSRIGGMTGDTYGAIDMLIEASVLLTFAVAP